MKPTRSKMMDALYGESTSQVVYDRCQSLSPKFNQLVQNVVYDVIWAMPGLTLKEKSLVTIVTLITLNKEEQLRIHLSGFFHLGGTPNDIAKVINYMLVSKYIRSSDKALKILAEVTSEKGLKLDNINNKALKEILFQVREHAIVDLVAHIALADERKTRNYLKLLLKNKMLSENDIENVLLHEMIYSGFPCAMNGFAILKSIFSVEQICPAR